MLRRHSAVFPPHPSLILLSAWFGALLLASVLPGPTAWPLAASWLFGLPALWLICALRSPDADYSAELSKRASARFLRA